MNKDIEILESTIAVDSEIRLGDEVKKTQSDNTLFVHKFQTEPAVVTIEKKLTRRLGDYESASIKVTVSVPCYREQVDAALDAACGIVSKRIAEADRRIKKARKR